MIVLLHWLPRPSPPGGSCAGYGAEQHPHPRTYTRHPRKQITAAARFLTWLTDRHTSLRDAARADLDTWLADGPARGRPRRAPQPAPTTAGRWVRDIGSGWNRYAA
ncbi:MAG: hypothetical protein ACRDRO_06295 [Pseudonocardiaceae bacterium]